MIDISVDTSKVSQYLLDIADKQMPFACAKALTKTAQQGQNEIRRLLPARFNLRNNWVSQGVRIMTASKSNLQSSIYSKDDFMTLQEAGGTKTPRGQNIAVPTDNVRRNKRDIISKANRPRALGDKAGYFIGEVKGILGLWKRPPKGQSRAARRNGGYASPKLLFRFEHTAKVRKRWGFEDTVSLVAQQNLTNNLNTAISEAIQ